MSKRSRNNKDKSKYFLPKSSNKSIAKRNDLKHVLDGIYGRIDLSTSCSHNLCCCKVGCPQMNYSEFVSLVTYIWNNFSQEEKIKLICKSIEYLFKYDYEKWEMDSLVKPCMLLDEKEKKCTVYENRPLNCRMYGLWPEEDYEKRVDRFAKVYEKYNLKREQLPLNKQCNFVKRLNDSQPITTEAINDLFSRLDNLDKKVGNFTDLQVNQRENYRTFHDWLLLKILGEEWLSGLTGFLMVANRESMEDQIEKIKETLDAAFIQKGVPDITKLL